MVIRVSSAACAEAVMHAVKRSPCDVLGFLIGSHSGEGAAAKFDISAVVPVLHSNPTAPVLEMAARVVSQWCQEHHPSETIVGIYFANERSDDDSVKPQVAKVAASIHAKIGAAAMLQILNRTLGRSACVFKGFHRTATGQTEAAVEYLDNEAALEEMFGKAFAQQWQSRIQDFEDFLDTPSADFTNAEFKTFIKSA